jgi:hypothetical protein
MFYIFFVYLCGLNRKTLSGLKNHTMKKEVFKFTALIILTMLPSMIYAQLNPKQGYIITNQNDTIYGTIDYLSDTKCAYNCRFMPAGETEYKVYKPGEIAAYRFSNNGVFYITKTFKVENEQKTFFAEYLVKGGVSLFHHKENDIDYYYFVDEKGKIAITKYDGSDLTPTYENLAYQSRVNKKRAALGKVTPIFAQSPKALHDLWTKDLNPENLTQITIDYDMEYCTSAGDCVQYRYNEEASRSVDIKLRFLAGLGYGKNKLSGAVILVSASTDYYSNPLTMNCVLPQLGIGADLLFPRYNSHWSLEGLALISKWSMTGEYYAMPYDKNTVNTSLKYFCFETQMGAAYSFLPKAKLSPILRGGIVAEVPFAIKCSNLYTLNCANSEDPFFAFGFYAGVGVDIPIQKHVFRLSADYQLTHSKGYGVDISSLMINAGIRL